MEHDDTVGRFAPPIESIKSAGDKTNGMCNDIRVSPTK